jgi:imidazolonepropionase-like amidohydrolase
VPSAQVAAAVVTAAHAAGREVTAHALTVAMVERALDAGVDELAHLPVEPLPGELVERLVAAQVTVVTTMETLLRDHSRAVVDNAAAIVAAGGTLRYGTDLGNGGTRPGADPAELKLLADEVGLGPDGALRAATEPVKVGEPAGLVALADDPRGGWQAYRHPQAVLVGRALLT